MGNIAERLRHHWEQLVDNFAFSAILSTATTWFMTYTGGDKHALFIWLGMSMADCILGVTRAVIFRQFSEAKLHTWFLKIGTQAILILLFAAMMHTLRIAAGIDLVLTNWLVLFFAFFDFSTCIDKLIAMRAPVPRIVIYIVQKLRLRVADTVGTAIGASEEEVEDIKKALDTTTLVR